MDLILVVRGARQPPDDVVAAVVHEWFHASTNYWWEQIPKQGKLGRMKYGKRRT